MLKLGRIDVLVAATIAFVDAARADHTSYAPATADPAIERELQAVFEKHRAALRGGRGGKAVLQRKLEAALLRSLASRSRERTYPADSVAVRVEGELVPDVTEVTVAEAAPLEAVCDGCGRRAPCITVSDGTTYRPTAWLYPFAGRPLLGVCSLCQEFPHRASPEEMRALLEPAGDPATAPDGPSSGRPSEQ